MQPWNELIATLPNPHFLQTQEWAAVKAQTGWQPHYLYWIAEQGAYHRFSWKPGGRLPDSVSAAALILQRTLPILGFAARLRLLYCPKGPLLDWSNAALRQAVLEDLRRVARQQGAIFIKIDPDVPMGTGLPGSSEDQPNPVGAQVASELSISGWRTSGEQIQFRNTVWIDLTASAEELLGRMKPKARYNIRLAERNGVTVRTGGIDDLELLYRMYAETSRRDGFIIRPREYYYHAWSTFFKAGLGEALVAEVDQEPVAALVLFRFASAGWYVYGMSRDLHRDRMPNHLLQWKAIRSLKAAGCRSYDLWGAPDVFIESDPMWGVFRFKHGLGGEVRRHLGAWDLPTRPLLYRLYTQVLPRLLEVMRRRERSSSQARLPL